MIHNKQTKCKKQADKQTNKQKTQLKPSQSDIITLFIFFLFKKLQNFSLMHYSNLKMVAVDKKWNSIKTRYKKKKIVMVKNPLKSHELIIIIILNSRRDLCLFTDDCNGCFFQFYEIHCVNNILIKTYVCYYLSYCVVLFTNFHLFKKRLVNISKSK